MITVHLGSVQSSWAFLTPFVAVLLGGVITLAINLYFARRKERDERLGLGYSVFFKVQRIVDQVSKARLHVNGAQAPDELLWRVLPPVLGVRNDPVEFTPAELAIFARKKDAKFAQLLMDAESFHGLLLALILEYNRRKQVLGDAIADVVQEDSDNPDNLRVEGESLVRLRPKILETNSVALSLRKVANDPRLPLEVLSSVTGLHIRRTLADKRFDLTMNQETRAQTE